jgi:hypothetical protein
MRTNLRSCSLACFVIAASLGVPALGQTCIDDTCYVDRGASGDINLGPLDGGVCVIDYDNDGWPDLVVRALIGQLARLFHNVPDPVRDGERTFVDVTASTGLAAYTGVGATTPAALAADFDNDGWTDIYLLGRRNGDPVSGRLYRNTHDGGFVDVTQSAGVGALGDNQESASFADYDLDGRVDLMVVSRTGSAHLWLLYRNMGDGTFTDVTAAVLPQASSWARMYSHTWTDYDADGFPDVFMIPNSGPVVLHNVPDGAGGRRLEYATAEAGFTFLGPAPMGISAGDYDNDGDFDIGLSNGAIGAYYENIGGSMAQRLLVTSIWAWGTLWIDANNDGLLDLYQAGSVGSSANHNKLFLNRGAGVFEDISPALNDLYVGSQFAVQLDFNNDGRQDIVTMNPYNTPLFVSVNENVSPAGRGWIKVRVRGDGVRANADAIGAVVRVRTGGVVQSREVTSGSSTCSTDDFRQNFGLGSAAAADEIEVIWPRAGTIGERTQVFAGPFPSGTIVELRAECRADFNGDRVVNSQDVFDFLAALFGGAATADVNGDGATNSQDFFDFLGAFFGGC